MAFYEVFDAVFFITITTILTGSIGLALKFCLKSKCNHVECCWGGFVINRNVELENDIEQSEPELENEENKNNI
jgi:hypothetical protein